MIKKVFPPLALALFSVMLGAGLIIPLLPLYAHSLGANITWLGIISASFFVASVISTPLFGRLSDRKGRKVFIAIGLLCYGIISLSFIWATTVYQLTLVRFLQGIAGGMIVPLIQAYVGDMAPPGAEGKWMGYFNATLLAGFGIGPLLGGTLTEHLGMTIAFVIMAGLSLIAFLIVILYVPNTTDRKIISSPRFSFKEMGQSRTIRGLVGFRLAFAFSRGILTTFLPLFASIRMGLSPAFIGVLMAAVILLMSLPQTYGGNLADRFSRFPLVVIGSVTNLVFLALIPLTGNFWQLLTLCLFGSLGTAIALPAVSALIVEEGRKFGMGSTMAVFSVAFSAGMGIGSILGGIIGDFAGMNSTFYLGAGIGLLGTILFIYFNR